MKRKPTAKKTPARKRAALDKKAAFLAAFEETYSVTRAARGAHIARSLHYRWLEEDEDYAARFDKALVVAGGVLEDEAVRRAVEGIEEPVVYQGAICYVIDPKTKKFTNKPLVVRKYSDTVLLTLLRAARPEKYRERASVEHSGPGGGPIPVRVTKRAAMLADLLSPDELDKLRTRLSSDAPGDRGGDTAPTAE